MAICTASLLLRALCASVVKLRLGVGLRTPRRGGHARPNSTAVLPDPPPARASQGERVDSRDAKHILALTPFQGRAPPR